VLTSDQKGAVAEAAVAHAAAKLGFGVMKPLTVERYDLIVDLRPRLLRVQCKWAVRYRDGVVVRCRTCRRGRDGFIRRDYSPAEVDAVAAYCAELDACYLVDLNHFGARSAVQLRLSPPRNNQRSRVHRAEEFTLAATLKRLAGP
jgi:hypothetical protein